MHDRSDMKNSNGSITSSSNDTHHGVEIKFFIMIGMLQCAKHNPMVIKLRYITNETDV